MTDFATVWNAATQTADWCIEGPDLGTDAGLTTAVIISLMTDRLANADDVIPDGTANRRGTWMDLPLDTTAKADATPDLMGSRWWLLARAKATEQTRQNFIAYTQEALVWGVDDGVWDAVGVQAWLVPIGQLVGIVTITRMTAAGPVNHLFDLAWSATMGGMVTPQGVAAFAPTIVPLPYPDPPLSVTVSGVTSATATLIWSPAITGGAPASYTVNASLTGAGIWAPAGTIAAPATGLTATGLIPGTAYDFEAFATNATGSGATSAIVTATTAVNPPQAATSVVMAAGSPAYSTCAVSWVAPVANGTYGAATAYTVFFRLHGAGSWTQFATGIAGLAETVTGLAHDTAYDFLIVPYNAGGPSVTNNGGSDFVTGTAAPNAPAVTIVAPVNDGSNTNLAVTWTASATDGTHDAATGYNLQWRTTVGPGSWTLVSGVTSGAVIASLTPATSYDVEVQGVNASAASPGAWSSATTASTYATAVTWGTSGAPASTQSRSTTNVLGAADPAEGGLNGVTTPQAYTVSWAMAAGNTVIPTTGLQVQAYNGPTYGWGVYYTIPANGTYYFWSIAYNVGGTVIGAWVSGAITVTA